MSNSIHKKRIEAEKNGGKDEKVFYKLINNAVYGKEMIEIQNLRIKENNLFKTRKQQKGLFKIEIFDM